MAVDEVIQSRIERLHRLKVDAIWVTACSENQRALRETGRKWLLADLIHHPLACRKKTKTITKMSRNAKGFFECFLYTFLIGRSRILMQTSA